MYFLKSAASACEYFISLGLFQWKTMPTIQDCDFG
jgi:hypothetical protein